ncbi:Uncharacterized protein BM_BM13243, partial [Brugia malayi]
FFCLGASRYNDTLHLLLHSHAIFACNATLIGSIICCDTDTGIVY